MNLVVLGATGRTGRLVVEQALAAGHTVTALVRSPEKLPTGSPNLRVVTGQATDTSAVSRALEGADAVIRLLTGIAMGGVIKDKSAGEQLLRRSDLDWTIVYASLLNDGPANGFVTVLPEHANRSMSEKISRADVAAWMV